MKTRNFLIVIGAALFLAWCASVPPTAVHETAGPQPLGLHPPEGFLKVYSATEEHQDGDNTYRYPHTGYRIYARDGRLFKGVRNAIGSSDEDPANVRLPSGRYTVVADSETAGTVSVPVVIRTGKTTTLHLEREKDWTPPALARGSDFVRLPNGQPD